MPCDHHDTNAGKKGRGPVQVKQVPKESFFNFFAAVEVPSEDQEIDEEQVSA
jgi:hypothetical protein